jgi:hypothetical protein
MQMKCNIFWEHAEWDLMYGILSQHRMYKNLDLVSFKPEPKILYVGNQVPRCVFISANHCQPKNIHARFKILGCFLCQLYNLLDSVSGIIWCVHAVPLAAKIALKKDLREHFMSKYIHYLIHKICLLK